MESARQQAATLADTSAHAAAYAGRQAAWKAGGTRYLKWHSILDTRTSIGCAVRAGKLYTLDFQPVNHDVPIDLPPPRHFNCRSILIAMAPGFDPPGDGQDSYSESLSDWLKRQLDSEQDALLGPTRAALWRAGKLDTRGLLGRDGEVLSVGELAGLHGKSAAEFVGSAIATPRIKQPVLPVGRYRMRQQRAQEFDVDVSGKMLALDRDGVIHAMRQHGTAASEVPRGQIPIDSDDIANFAEIFNAAQLSISDPATSRDGARLLRGEAVATGWRYSFVAKVRKRDVTLYTIWKRRNRTD